MSSMDPTGISDQTMFIYSWLTFGVVIQAFNLFGIITNIINIICFWRIGFDDSVNISLLGLSLSDIGSLITMILTSNGFTPAMAVADLSFLPQEVMYPVSTLPHVSFTRVSSCITAMITLERCLCITVPLQVKTLITPKRTTIINICLFLVFFIIDIPNFVVNTLGLKYVPSRNKTLLGIVGTKDREIVQKFSFIINTFSIPFGAFLVIVVCTTILSVQLRKHAKWRAHTITSSENDKVTSRNYKTAKMVVMVSTLFIVCFVPISTASLAVAFVPGLTFYGKYVKVVILIGGLGYLLESVNSSVNIFFYYTMSRHFRNAFRNLALTKESRVQ